MKGSFSEHIKRFKEGNYTSFDEFYNKLNRPIFYNIYSLTHNHELSEELLQETFTKFLMNVVYIDEGENVLGYLITISRNLTLDYFKKYGRVRNFEEHEVVHVNDKNSIDKTLLLDKIATILKPKELEIFTLHVLSEMTFEEIASLKKIAIGTVLWSYNNSIKKIRKGLGEL